MRKKMSLVTLVLILAAGAFAAAPDNMYRVVPAEHTGLQELPSGVVVYSTLGACGYNDVTGDFYTVLFGSTGQSIRKFTPDVFGPVYYEPTDIVDDDPGYPSTIDDIYGSSWMYASASDLPRVANADWDFSTGVTDFNLGGYISAGGFVVNPAPVTVDGIDYEAGELALITQHWYVRHYDPTGTFRIYEHDYDKIALLYDLRRIGSPTTELPDYDTGQDGTGGTGELWGAFGQADWNDVFRPLVSARMLFDVSNTYLDYPELSTLDYTSSHVFNYMRQGCWASDASAVYFAGSHKHYDCLEEPDEPGVWTEDVYGGGIWKVNLSDMSIELLLPAMSTSSSDRISTEVWSIHTSVRDFTGGTRTGEQIIFEGTGQTGNEGGLLCVVDDGTGDTTTYTVVDAELMEDLRGGLDSVYGVTCDPDGNVYFTLGSRAAFKYDTEGRVYALNNRGQYMCYNGDNNLSITSTHVYRLQYHDDVYGYPVLTHMTQAGDDAVGGIVVTKPCDFDRDGDFDIDDLNFFRDQRIYNDSLEIVMEDPEDPESDVYIAELNFDTPTQATVDYFKADINGTSEDYESISGTYYAENKSVDEYDAKVLYQFATPGDINLDGVVDMTDYNLFIADYPKVDGTVYSWTDGDFSFDGNVDSADAALFCAYWDSPDASLLWDLLINGDLKPDNTVDFADIALFSANYPEVDSGYDSTWGEGDFNDDGDVTAADLLLAIDNWLIN
ncbi:hypothetical protein SMSP2_01445 [Limihaloglobus sulfuriphilus]|uniref:Dockerin domain-containing protein n=1 Tax=Limihaloglobus sulfuriphilus TaxID=1851148 RepID=A0A1Q2MEF3_9BACT|nr:dockerin type I domain-containing protein [Limihaloglobus sulfuriphilus]AQQ71081.1 hypothetical protein SMSP2_01445 [Limihaloglobus sulfuriphilus]